MLRSVKCHGSTATAGRAPPHKVLRYIFAKAVKFSDQALDLGIFAVLSLARYTKTFVDLLAKNMWTGRAPKYCKHFVRASPTWSHPCPTASAPSFTPTSPRARSSRVQGL